MLRVDSLLCVLVFLAFIATLACKVPSVTGRFLVLSIPLFSLLSSLLTAFLLKAAVIPESQRERAVLANTAVCWATQVALLCSAFSVAVFP